MADVYLRDLVQGFPGLFLSNICFSPPSAKVVQVSLLDGSRCALLRTGPVGLEVLLEKEEETSASQTCLGVFRGKKTATKGRYSPFFLRTYLGSKEALFSSLLLFPIA
jgi:hypothetical protein